MPRKMQKQDTDPYILSLRRKFNDENYVKYAIQRIAQVLSERIIEERMTVYGMAGVATQRFL